MPVALAAFVCWRSLDFAHIPMVYGRYVTIVPGDRDRVPTYFAYDTTISGVPLPVHALAFLESLGFGDFH
jgi:hypothetical protein